MSLDVNTATYASAQSSTTAKSKCNKPSFGIKGDSEKLAGQPAEDTVNLQVKTGLLTDNMNGEIGGKDFSLNVKSNLMGKKTFTGTIDGKNYELTNTRKGITGTIGEKAVNIEFKTDGVMNFLSGKYKAVGTIGDEKIDLLVDKSTFSQTMTGNFKDKKVDLKFKSDFGKSTVSGNIENEQVNMKFKGNGIFKSGMKAEGKYNGDSEFFPILISSYYANEENAKQNMAAITA